MIKEVSNSIKIPPQILRKQEYHKCQFGYNGRKDNSKRKGRTGFAEKASTRNRRIKIKEAVINIDTQQPVGCREDQAITLFLE